MKKLSLACCVLLSQISFAGVVQKLDHEQTLAIAQILLNPSVAECVRDFQKDRTHIQHITKQQLGPQTTRYVFEATRRNIDMAEGQTILTITETMHSAPWGNVPVYTCNVVRESF